MAESDRGDSPRDGVGSDNMMKPTPAQRRVLRFLCRYPGALPFAAAEHLWKRCDRRKSDARMSALYDRLEAAGWIDPRNVPTEAGKIAAAWVDVVPGAGAMGEGVK